jgi:hypothetical protein
MLGKIVEGEYGVSASDGNRNVSEIVTGMLTIQVYLNIDCFWALKAVYYKSSRLRSTCFALLIPLFYFPFSNITMGFHPDSLPDLTGKVYIVTGGNSGMFVSPLLAT